MIYLSPVFLIAFVYSLLEQPTFSRFKGQFHKFCPDIFSKQKQKSKGLKL